MRPFVDTSVLVYAHDQDEPEKQAAALQLLEELSASMVLSVQVLAEFYVAVTRKLARPMDAATAGLQISELAHCHVVAADADLVLEAARLSLEHQLSLWDAMIVRAAVRGGCETLLTEDLDDGATFDGVTIRNPFADATRRE